MSSTVLLFGLLPLLAFVIIDSFAGVRAGVIAGVLFAVGEMVYSFSFYGHIDELTIGETALILFFGFLSYKSQKEIYFKLQPVFLGTTFGLILLVMQLLKKPLLVIVLEKYQYMIPEDIRSMMMNEEYLKMLASLSGVLGWGFLVHAALVCYAAFRMSKWWWLLIRGIGLYIMMAACAVIVRFL